MKYFNQSLNTHASKQSLNTGIRNKFFDGLGFAKHQASLLVKILISLEPHYLYFYSNIVQSLVRKMAITYA